MSDVHIITPGTKSDMLSLTTWARGHAIHRSQTEGDDVDVDYSDVF